MQALSDRNVGLTSHKNEVSELKIVNCREICENTEISPIFPLKKVRKSCYFIFLKHPNISSVDIRKAPKIAKTEKMR